MEDNLYTHPTSPKDTENFSNPAPEKLSDVIERVDNRLGKIGLGLSGEAFEILRDMDEISDRLSVMKENGSPAVSELAQYDTFCKTIKKEAGLLLREMGGTKALENARVPRNPDPDHWWWYLERVIAEKRSAEFKRRGMICGIVLLVFAVLAVIYYFFFQPDPNVIAVFDARSNAETNISKGQLQAALADIDRGLVKQPGSTELLVFKGTILDAMGRQELSKPIYAQAEKIMNDPENFLLMRGQFYQTLGLYDASIADMNTLLKTNPKSAKAFLLMGTAFELKQDVTRALNAYETASKLGIEGNDSMTVAQARVKLGMLMQSAELRMGNTQEPTQTTTSTPIK